VDLDRAGRGSVLDKFLARQGQIGRVGPRQDTYESYFKLVAECENFKLVSHKKKMRQPKVQTVQFPIVNCLYSLIPMYIQ